MKNISGSWADIALIGTLLAIPACIDSGDARAPIGHDDANEGIGGAEQGDLAIQHSVGAFPGFPVDISIDGDDVVLEWNSPDPEGSIIVLRSTNPHDLVETDLATLPAGVDQFIPAGDSFVDTDAADRQSVTPNYFYRLLSVSQSDEYVSTMVMKTTTKVHPGYNKFGLCMLDGAGSSSELAAGFGGAVQNTYLWNETTQSWLWGDFALPYGGVVAVELDASTDPYLSMVGTVPTNEPFEINSDTGRNLQTFPVFYDGPNNASYWVDSVGYWGVGQWDSLDQTEEWYWGPGDSDITLEACKPYYIQLSPDACDADAECNDGQYCKFDPATSCGDFGAGMCTPIQLGCSDENEPVCGCDGVTYANAGEAAAEGVSVAAEGECEPACVESDFFADADSDGYGDPAAVTSACEAPAGYVDNDDDCDDTDASVNPGATEVEGNGLDDDCDPATEDDPCTPTGFFADADGDGYGDPLAAVEACVVPPGYVDNDDDCDDTNAAVNPGETEVEGNGLDDDCDPATEDVMSCLPGGAVCDPFAIPNPCCAPNICLIGPNRCLN